MTYLKKEKNGRITDVHRKQMLKDFFDMKPKKYIYEKYGYTKTTTDKYLEGRASGKYIDSEGTIWKRCSVHRQYLKLDNFYKSGKYYMSRCKKCELQKKKNAKIIMVNIGEGHEVIYKSRYMWWKRSWKYNTRRKVLRIIGYLDVNGKIIR